MYPDATETRVCFQKDVTTEHVETITDYQAWHQFPTIDHLKDVEELVFPQLSESYDVLHGLLNPIFVSHVYMYIL